MTVQLSASGLPIAGKQIEIQLPSWGSTCPYKNITCPVGGQYSCCGVHVNDIAHEYCVPSIAGIV